MLASSVQPWGLPVFFFGRGGAHPKKKKTHHIGLQLFWKHLETLKTQKTNKTSYDLIWSHMRQPCLIWEKNSLIWGKHVSYEDALAHMSSYDIIWGLAFLEIFQKVEKLWNFVGTTERKKRPCSTVESWKLPMKAQSCQAVLASNFWLSSCCSFRWKGGGPAKGLSVPLQKRL